MRTDMNTTTNNTGVVNSTNNQVITQFQLVDFVKNYNGSFSFLVEIKDKFLKYGNLTPNQWGAVRKCYEREIKFKSNKPEPKDVSKLIYLKKFIAFAISEKHNLGDMRSYVWQTEQVLKETEKAIQVKAKIADADHTIGVCRNCGKALTNEFSQVTGMGKTCAKKWNIKYITKKEDAADFKREMQEKINAIGVLELWIPKSQITSEKELINENGIEK